MTARKLGRKASPGEAAAPAASKTLEEVVKLREQAVLRSPYHQALHGAVRRRLRGDQRVLDVGCGYGSHARRLSEGGAMVIGVDLRSTFVAAQPSQFACASGDATRLPFRDESFDLAFSLDLIEHVGDDLYLVRELYRVLSPGGVLLVETPNIDRLSVRLRKMVGHDMPFPRHYGDDPVLGPIVHIREYTSLQLVELVELAGFLQVEVEGIWLGLTRPEIGIAVVPKPLSALCQSFVISARKPQG